MRSKHGARLLVGLASALFFGVVAQACTPAAGGYCSKVCECSECADGAQDGCVDSVKSSREVADRRDCSGEFDDYLACSKDQIECGGEESSSPCDEEREALVACAGPSALPCFVSLYRSSLALQRCGQEIGIVYGGYCPAEYAEGYACIADCAEVASCEALAGTSSDPNDPYFSCVVGCPPF